MTEEQFKKEKALLKCKVTSMTAIIKNKKGGPKTEKKLANAKKAYVKFCTEWDLKQKQLAVTIVEVAKSPVITDIADCFTFDKIFFTETEIVKRYKKKIFDAKKRGIEFNISFETFSILLEQKECYYTGVKYKSLSEISIDRVDNDKGYVEGNCVSCLGEINGLKDDFKVIELQAIYERLTSGNQLRFKCTKPEEMKQIYLVVKQFVNRKPLEEFNPFN